MDSKTAMATAKYMITNAPKGKKINITWFGGEPLCNIDAIDVVSNELRREGIDFSAKIISNGYLFDKEVTQKAVEKWNVKSAQITLDGTAEVYNSVKAYASTCGNAFETVADNIEEMLRSGIAVFIRINLSIHNKDNLYRLVDWICDRYNGYKNIYVYPRVMMWYESGKAEYMISAVELLSFENYCLEKGLQIPFRVLGEGIRVNACMADSNSSVTDLPDGHLGQCEHFTDGEFVGDVFTGISDNRNIIAFKEKANCKEICEGCELYPICIRLFKCPDVGTNVCNSDFVAIEKAHLSHSINMKFS